MTHFCTAWWQDKNKSVTTCSKNFPSSTHQVFLAIKGVAPPREGVDAAIIIGTAGGTVRLLDKGRLRMSNMKLVIFAGFDDDAPYDVSKIFEGVSLVREVARSKLTEFQPVPSVTAVAEGAMLLPQTHTSWVRLDPRNLFKAFTHAVFLVRRRNFAHTFWKAS